MINLQVEATVISKLILAATIAGEPIIEGGVFKGIAVTDSDAFAPLAPATASYTLTATGGYWTSSLYALYAVTCVNAAGKESLPTYVVMGPTGAGNNDRVQLDWTDMSGVANCLAVSYNIYRGVSGASAALAGSDLVLLTSVVAATASALEDNGWSHTARSTTPGFEEVVPKAGSRRVPSSRSGSDRINTDDFVVPVLVRGVVEYNVSHSATHGIGLVVENAAAYWDATNKLVQTTSSGSCVQIGKFTHAYLPSDPTALKVGVEVNAA